MKYIKEHSSIPVPEIFDWSCSANNKIGIPFILMSKATGFPLGSYAWDPLPNGMISSQKNRPLLKRAYKEKIMTQLGQIASQLLHMRFETIGSLIEVDDKVCVQRSLSPALLWHERDSSGDDISRGPFQKDQECYDALISAAVMHVKELPIEQHVFFAPIPTTKEYVSHGDYLAAVDRWNDFVSVGAKIDSIQNRFDYCIAAQFLKQMTESLCPNPGDPVGMKGLPLQHPDLSTSNIFVDEDFNITCIIDLAFASTVPIPILLATPSFPHPRDQVDRSLEPFFKDGLRQGQKTYENSDQVFINQIWSQTRKAWLFSRLVIMDGLQDYNYFRELYFLVHEIPEEELSIPALFREKGKEKEFTELLEMLKADDRPLEEVKREEREYFQYDNEGKEAIARKLDVMVGLSTGFVGDKKPWGWVKEATKEQRSCIGQES